jgi:molybdate transport system substrate-binding protein
MTRLLALCVIALCAAAPVAAAELNVLAAASLIEVLRELAPPFQVATGHTLRFNFGASGALVRQIQEGAPADVILCADELRVDQLENAGLLLAGTRRTVLANTLVVVVAAEGGASVATLADLTKADCRRLAIGDPATVPAGTYTKAHLQALGLWESLLARLVPLATVRAVLAAVEAGNADAGFVYRTDALRAKRVKIAVAVPRAEGPRITYPLAVLRGARSPAAGRAFVAYLTGAEAQKVFAKFGFLPPS